MKRNMLMAMVMIVIVGAGISWSVAQTTQPAKKADKAKAKAPTEAYKIDNVHSSVVFKVGHLGVSSVYGRFNEAAGQFHHNAADPSQCKFVVTVKADSLDTNNKKRDEHVLGPDFLNAKEHKEIKFESTAVKKGKKKDELIVQGNLTLHGETKSISVTMKHIGSGKDPWGGFRRGFETSFTVKRSDFGMSKMLNMVGDEVTMMIALEGIKE